MNNRENSNVDIKEANQANIAQKAKEQDEDDSVQDHGGLEKGNGQQANEVAALPSQLDGQLAIDANSPSSQLNRRLENEQQNTDSDALRLQLDCLLENELQDTQFDALPSQLKKQLVISKQRLENMRTWLKKTTRENISLKKEIDKLQKKIINLNQQVIKQQEDAKNEVDHEDGRRLDEETGNTAEHVPQEDKNGVVQIDERFIPVVQALDGPTLRDNQLENRPDTDVDQIESLLLKLLENSEIESDDFCSLVEYINSLLEQCRNVKHEKDELEISRTKDLIYQVELQNKVSELKLRILTLEDNKNMELDQEDGKREDQEMENVLQDIDEKGGISLDEETGNTAENVPPEILPSVLKKPRDVHQSFRNPFPSCPVSCTNSAVYFFFMVMMEKELCSEKFSAEKRRQLNEGKNKELDENLEKCCFSLRSLVYIGLIHDEPLFHGESIKGTDNLDKKLQEGAEEMDKEQVSHALIKIVYWNGTEFHTHCMTISRCNDNSPACVEIFDAQSGRLWPNKTEQAESVLAFTIYKMNNAKAIEFAAKWEIVRCTEEYREANTSAQITRARSGIHASTGEVTGT